MKITLSQYRSLQSENAGYCTHCDDITHYSCEPDATKYECPECENRNVWGVELAMALELFEIIEDGEEVEYQEEEDEDY
jgi:predicted RNA-binding Zn-ribbon protein involved in translation (DUF1610 family)